ncbi:carboxypeptidase regulatory-like domain-containing protein [Amycolatopsis sp. SID8362]|uniref:carboxypeptidase regulatory-like domain-containing protein n=1 Tax=Amycolatopsis sp. SID8362 TaxID=2690346 RepID=UPI001369123F|nr:carboxypeptidase regulatory-like domain-containing protein [Amycolatopsis sp. SID8362]NBH02046.1 carboxypeptidase regulatory-like domain-containing protein [Amycolatopsis sp. SID8362]NED38749.1 carboxypeptidase regulatory-like domain-containing protein [Amycolatopsis sp. SID8362]
MNDLGAPGEAFSDDLILAGIGSFLDEFDPPPGDLVQRVQFALALEDLDVEVARWERLDDLAGVRGSGTGTITFTVSDLTVMINLTKIGKLHRIDGWLVPAGQYGVEVRVAEHGTSSTTADEGGRFVLDNVPRGTTQILVHLGDVTCRRTVVTPTVVL